MGIVARAVVVVDVKQRDVVKERVKVGQHLSQKMGMSRVVADLHKGGMEGMHETEDAVRVVKFPDIAVQRHLTGHARIEADGRGVVGVLDGDDHARFLCGGQQRFDIAPCGLRLPSLCAGQHCAAGVQRNRLYAQQTAAENEFLHPFQIVGKAFGVLTERGEGLVEGAERGMGRDGKQAVAFQQFAQPRGVLTGMTVHEVAAADAQLTEAERPQHFPVFRIPQIKAVGSETEFKHESTSALRRAASGFRGRRRPRRRPAR